MNNGPANSDVTAGDLRPREGGTDAGLLLLAGWMVLPLLAAVPALAQENGEPASAMITVTAPPSELRVLAPGVSLGSDALIDRQPRNLADALRALPGVSARTNSRGESVPRVRGSDERQTQVFLDGAPLVVPWDGRIDLGLIPVGLIGGVDVRKGAVPIEYGTNAVAGVVDLQTRRGSADGDGFTGVAQVGSLGFASLSGVASMMIGGADVVVAASHNSQDAVTIADIDALPFNQADRSRRTNTQSDNNSLFGAIGGEVGGILLRASVLHFDAKRGIPPESDRDPALFAPRYWQYPDIDFTQATVSAEARPADGAVLRVVGWRQWFSQTIEAYRSADYATLRSREHNDDDTHGARITLSHRAGPAKLRWSASAQSTTHVQIDTAIPPGVPSAAQRYRQNLLSLGVESDFPLSGASAVTLGVGYDRAANPLTGDKPSQPASDAFAFSAGVRHHFSDRLELTATGGRRTRFPSARELFGEALGRFLPNPDLQPETAWLGDVALTWRNAGMTVTVNPFVTRTIDGISQRVVRVGGQSLRQRFNLSGSTAFGVDALVLVPIDDDLTAEFTGTALQARADAGDATFPRLVQRPGYEIMAAVDWAPKDLFDIRAEVRWIGSAVDLAPDDTMARLPGATEVNLRAAVPIVQLDGGSRVALTAAVDNLTNALVVPQLGLPLAGRTLRIGIRVS